MREFSILESIAKMAEVTIAIEEETHRGLEHAARVVEAEAKREIGHYQDAAGPFAPWAQLAPSTLADKERKGYAPPDNPLLREGDLQDSIGHEVSGHEAIVGSMSDIAVYQELGTKHMPPRSFLGGAAVRKEEMVVELLGESFVTGLIGRQVFRGRLPIRE